MFILLTGFLNNKKEISWKYYRGLIPLLLSYFLISFIELFGINMFTVTKINTVDISSGDSIVAMDNRVITVGETAVLYTPENLEKVEWPAHITKVFNFTENSYAWYFEMYIGLFFKYPMG